MEIRYDKVAGGVRQLQQALGVYLEAVPALLWHVDTVRNEMIFFNDHKVAGLNGRIPMMLKNSALAKALIHPEDFRAFRGALGCIRSLQPSAVSFRVCDDAGSWHWLVMLGMPAPDESFCYVGLVTECTGLAESILGRESGVSLRESIELLDNPVLLVDFTDKGISAANAAARELFGYAQAEDFPALDSMLSGVSEQYQRSIYEYLIFNAQWRGVLSLRDAIGARVPCAVQLRPVARSGIKYLWVSLEPLGTVGEPETFGVPVTSFVPSALYGALDTAHDTAQALHALLEHQPSGMQAEGVMLSRIFATENRVVVTGVGFPFQQMEGQTEYPYAGSIAENIVQYNLPYLVVEETSRSIRPIDWALFIPGGIHSYYAEPYFEEGVLRYVLIFCSTRPAAFDAGGVPACKDMLTLLARTLERVGQP